MLSLGMSWTLVVMAGAFEIFFAIGLKHVSGFERPWIALGTAGSLLGSLVLLSIALRQLPVGSAYAVWTGIGAAGTALVGIFVLGDPATLARLVCIAVIIGGVVGLQMAS